MTIEPAPLGEGAASMESPIEWRWCMAHNNETPVCRECFKRIVQTLRDLTDSAEGVVSNWERGDLAGAVNSLDGDADKAKELLADIDASGLLA